MKNNDLCLPEKRLYQPPVSEEFALSTQQMLCASGDQQGATEVWGEVDLSAPSFSDLF